MPRLGNDKYKKSNNTVQDNLTKDDIDILLEDYNEVEDYKDLKAGMHIRYYTIIKNNKYFRMGGTIIKIDLDNKYIVLTNNNKSTWSVQLANSIIYKKMTTEEIKKFYENELDNKDAEIEKYKSVVNKVKNQQKMLMEENERLNKEIKNIKKSLQKAGYTLQ